MVVMNEVLILKLDTLTSLWIADVTLDTQNHSREHLTR